MSKHDWVAAVLLASMLLAAASWAWLIGYMIWLMVN